MTRDDIIKLAREAAAKHGHTLKDEPEQATVEFLEAFFHAAQAQSQDAKRYRWLKNNPEWLGWDHDFRPDEVEREVDNAMKEHP